jgi:hypothetical protein
MTFEFTARCATVFKRKLEVEMKDIVEVFTNAPNLSIDEVEKSIDDGGDWNLQTICFKEFRMSVEIDFTRDDDDNEIQLDSLKLAVRIYYKKVRIGHIVLKDDFNIFDQEIDKLVKEYKICPCGQLEKKDGWCRYCYPLISTQEDICSICHENEGVWIKLKCNHLVHRPCWYQMENHKCPLCRAVQQRNEYETL